LLSLNINLFRRRILKHIFIFFFQTFNCFKTVVFGPFNGIWFFSKNVIKSTFVDFLMRSMGFNVYIWRHNKVGSRCFNRQIRLVENRLVHFLAEVSHLGTFEDGAFVVVGNLFLKINLRIAHLFVSLGNLPFM